MKYDDDELNQLLQPLRSKSPDDLQMKRWQMAVQREAGYGRGKQMTMTKSKWVLQLIAAMFVGAVVGVALLKLILPSSETSVFTQMTFHDATFERSHANLD